MSLAEHLARPCGRGAIPDGSHTGAAGGAACGDLVRVSLALDRDRVVAAGFDARGCGTAIAAASAAVALVEGRELLDAARVGADQIASELGGLGPSKRHAAELAADALHRALGAAARAGAEVTRAPGRILVAMSGGVDSAVAAVLSGTRAVAVTLELWSDPQGDGERSCCSPQAVRAARRVAHDLGLPHLSIDLREEFRAGVVEPWLAGHAAGMTPNPCVNCNGHVRLDAMLEMADRLGADGLATGHYARVRTGRLHVAADTEKDQSYMLAALAPAMLRRMRFPLGELHKPAVRELARRSGLAVAAKPDSQDLCFLAGMPRDAFLARHGGLGERAGAIVDASGRRLGSHGGAHRFTVGQRRGLRHRRRHAALRARDRRRREHRHGRSALGARDADGRAARRGAAWAARQPRTASLPAGPDRLHAGRCRELGRLLTLEEPVLGVAPGQLACLMDGDAIVGHGTIVAPPPVAATAG